MNRASRPNTRSLVSVIAVAAAALAAPAYASAADASAQQSDNASTGDIVVTATKRNESLVKVPIQVTVLTMKSIEAAGIIRPQDYLISTPNVTFIDEGTGDSFTNIRGQTSVRNSDPNVAVVIDGVQLSSLKQFNQDLFAIEQIEVLKGPQSAIYGRNAAAGAIVVTTRKPGKTLEGDVLAGYGSWNSSRFQGYVSGPLTDTLGFSVAASTRDTDGPFTNITTGEKSYRLTTTLGQARLLFQPTDAFTMDLKVSGHRTTGGSTALQSQFVGLPIGGHPVTELDADRTDLPFVTNVPGKLTESMVDVSLMMEYDFGFAKLTSVTAYDKLDQFFGGDSPPYLPDSGVGDTVQGYTYHDRNFSQELRLTSRSDQRFRWQVGAYFLSFRRGQISELNQDLVGVVPDTAGIDLPGDPNIGATLSYAKEKYRTESFAPFASFQFDITPTTHLSAAGRYDIERRRVQELAPDAINPATGRNYNLCIVANPGFTQADCQLSKTFRQFEPKVSLSQDLDGLGSIYASYGKGFKSGGFNPIGSRSLLLAVAPPGAQVFVQDRFDAETSTSWEIGTKLRLFDRALSFNAAVFTTDVKNAQQFEFFPSAGLQTTTGIDKVKLRGFEFDFTLQIPNGGPKLFGGYGYTDGKVKAFAANPAFVGNRSPNTNKYNLNLGITQDIGLGGNLTLVPRVTYTRLGSIWWDVANTPGTRRSPVDLVDARLSLRGGDRWDLSVFSNNLLNKQYNRSVLPLLGVFALTSRALPRYIGVEGRYRF
ncbi:TonB-dependent receptor [Novosphingobium sp. KCTC 2891]|uniref:TonB-dependent receptor n=1 Tax=Novosphingobium sp. KCTC 2891 TaxID=2989730 RepID=UPI00222161B1|nr:TonB-dependent receptor [Novosphingobium sp. KCTC 2891]MCW1383774.1 TonB-dependent receptor [Novosphingobium sp. KCTC 2891]